MPKNKLLTKHPWVIPPDPLLPSNPRVRIKKPKPSDDSSTRSIFPLPYLTLVLIERAEEETDSVAPMEITSFLKSVTTDSIVNRQTVKRTCLRLEAQGLIKNIGPRNDKSKWHNLSINSPWYDMYAMTQEGRKVLDQMRREIGKGLKINLAMKNNKLVIVKDKEEDK